MSLNCETRSSSSLPRGSVKKVASEPEDDSGDGSGGGGGGGCGGSGDDGGTTERYGVTDQCVMSCFDASSCCFDCY